MNKWLDRYESGGGLVSKNSLNRNVTCSNCGWSWKLSDGGLDPMTCHKCGGDIKMREGGELDEYQIKGEVQKQVIPNNPYFVTATDSNTGSFQGDINTTTPINTNNIKSIIPQKSNNIFETISQNYVEPITHFALRNTTGYRYMPGNLSQKDTTIDLTNAPMTFAKVNQNAKGNTIIGGEYIENSNNSVRKAKDWMNVKSDDTYSDKKYPSNKIQSFYGVENGKFKVGKATDFNPDTEIVPRRFGQTNINKAVLNKNSGMRLLDKNNNPIYQNSNDSGKFILYSPSTKKAQFSYISNGAKGVDVVNNFIKNNKDAQFIQLDNGRYDAYTTNPLGLTEKDFNQYYEQDWKREGTPGYNLIIQKNGGQLNKYQNRGEVRYNVPTSDVMQNRVPIGMQQIPTDPLTGQPLTREQISRFMPSFNTQQPVISQGTWKGNRTTIDNNFHDPYLRIIEQDPESEANIGKRMRKDFITKKVPAGVTAAAAIMAAPLAAPIVSAAMSAPLTIGSTILPYVTPATVIGAGFGLTGANNLANDFQSGYYFNPKISKSEKIFTGLTTGLDMLGTPGAVEAIGSHLITPAYKGALGAGKYLTEETALKNAYKLNSGVLKENPETFLYRAEPSNFNSQSTIDFMKQEVAAGRGKPWYKPTIKSYEEGHPKLMAQNDFHGQWLEKDPARLDFYLNSGDKVDVGTPMSILRTKIPTSEAGKYSVANNAKASVISASPNTEFVMPRNIIEQGEKFPASSWQQLMQEDKAFNTPHWLKGYGKKSNLKVFTEGQPYEGAPHIYEDMVPINGRYQPRTVITDAGVKDEILGLEATPVIPLNQIEYPVTSNKFLYGPHNSFGKMEQGVVTDTYRGMPPGTNTYTSTLPSYTNFPNNNIIQPWVAQELPGLHLKSTLKGSPLEKQLSKTGDININNIKSYIAKADVGQQDKFIIDKVLNEKFSGATKINYNDFRKAVSEELVPLERNIINNYEHNNWGLGKLGYPSAKKSSFDAAIKNSKQEIDRLENLLKDKGNIEPTSWETSDQIRQRLQLQLDDIKTQYAKSIAEYENLPLENSSITYSNQSKFGKGSADHFDESTLGHARTLVSKEEPDVMHILEQQSDYWQKGGKQKQFDLEQYKEVLAKREANYINDLEILKKLKETKKDYAGNPKSDYEIQQFEDIINKKGAELQLRKGDIANPIQKEFLGKNHQERLLQENVAYAVEQGKSKVRVPTSETAVKIQGYKPITQSPKPERVNRLKESIAHQKEMVSKRINPDGRPMNQGDIDHYEMNIMGLEEELYTKTKYSPEYETILKKYSEQPKTIKKLFGVEPKVVTDSKGNSWYEFDIPDAAKKGKFEIKAFRNGGAIITNRGQWDYPGQTTIIPSNQITMQGVPYPVVGVDNTGHTKMMHPGMNYTFPGQYVTEYPMMQYGGLTKYQNKGEVKKSSNIVSRENISGDALTSTLKREAVAAFPYLQGIGKSIEKGISYITPDYKSQEDRELLFRRHRPVAYPSISGGLADVVRDYSSRIFNTEMQQPFRDKDGDYEASEEAWRMTLGLPVKSKYIIPSAYRPLNETNKASKYYTLNENMYNKDLLRKKVEELKLKPGQSANLNSFAPFINENYMNKDEFSQVDPLQNFQIGINKDGKMYFYDKYDFDFEPATKVVKPYEYEFYNEFKTGGEMIKRADGSYSRRGLWDNIRAAAGSGKKPTTQMLEQERKIRNKYEEGGGITLNAGGEQHRIYVKSTNRGEGDKGHIMVNHPTMNKGMWDTIDLTQKAGATTIAQGVAATKEWHRENPYMKQRGGEEKLWYYPKEVKINEGTSYYNPPTETFYINPDNNIENPELVKQHELYHHLQNINGGLQLPQYYSGPLKKPNMMLNDELQGSYYNRRGIDEAMMYDKKIKKHPDWQFIPRDIIYNPYNTSSGTHVAGTDEMMYEEPWTSEGEARDYENYVAAGGDPMFKNGGYVVRRSHDRKGKTHVVTGPDGTKKYFGDPNMGERGNSKYGKEAFYARHKSNLAKNPYFRAYARATWKEGGEIMAIGGQTMMNPVTRKDNRNWLEFLKN